jgi:hypothetical protein
MQSGIEMLIKAVSFCMRASLLILVLLFWPIVVYAGMMTFGLSCEVVVAVVVVVAAVISVASEATYEGTVLPGPEEATDGLSVTTETLEAVKGEAGEAGEVEEVGTVGEVEVGTVGAERRDSPNPPNLLSPLLVYNLRNRQVKQLN